MSWARDIVIIAAVSLVGAGIVAFVSRAPAQLRQAEPPPEATEADLGASFTDQQVRRHAAYRGPGYLSFAISTLVQIVVLLAAARVIFPRLVSATEGLWGGWVARNAVLGAAAFALLWLTSLPLSFVTGYAIEHAWGRSTQDVVGWLGDMGRGFGVGAVTTAIAALAFFGIVRWQPTTWWLWGWLGFTALTALLVFLFPVVIAPLFNRFTPLADESLARRIQSLAGRAGVAVDEVVVADASRRTTTENAYVAGLGATKRVVLYDNLLRADEDPAKGETLFVAAHELAHEAEGHVWKSVVIASAGLLVAFAVLWWLSQRDAVWSWAGASGISDLRAIPLLIVFSIVAGVLLLPLQSGISRHHEARADEIAVRLTGDPEVAVRTFRRLAFSNLADLRPPRVAVWLFFSHPPIPDRIRAALANAPNAP